MLRPVRRRRSGFGSPVASGAGASYDGGAYDPSSFTMYGVPQGEHSLEEVEAGIPSNTSGFLRAWAFTILNWGVKVLVLAWVLGLLGVSPLAATFGGALGGELSSVLPVHAPGGVGTYPAGIAAGAVAFGAAGDKPSLASLGQAAINAHLLIVASACLGTALSIVLSWLPAKTR